MSTQANLYVDHGTDFGINLELTAEVNQGDVFVIMSVGNPELFATSSESGVFSCCA